MINTRNIFTNGDRVVFVFLFVTYIFPYFFNYLVFENIVTDYKSFRPGIDELQYILSVICIYILLSFFFKSFKFNKEVDFRNAFVIILSSLIRYRLILLLVLILISPLWFQSELSTYRYSSATLPMSEQSPILFVFIIANLIIYTYFFWRIFFSEQSDKKYMLADISFALFTLMTISGTFAALLSLLFITFAVAPRVISSFILVKKVNITSLKSRLKVIFLPFFLIFIIFLILAMAITLGSVIAKSGNFESIFSDWFDSEFYIPFALYLGERISVHYYAFAYTISDDFKNYVFDPLFTIDIIKDTFLFRLDVIAGGIFDITKPEISSISNYNYYVTSNFPRIGEGTAPGLFGSINYLFPIPIAVLFSALSLNIYSFIIDNLSFSREGLKLTFVGTVIFYFFTKEIFFSPIDIFLIFDEGLISIFLLMIVIIPNLGRRKSV